MEEFQEQLPQWISVSERMPAVDERVLIYHAAAEWVSIGNRRPTGDCHWVSDAFAELDDPTHWMPLPEPPE